MGWHGGFAALFFRVRQRKTRVAGLHAGRGARRVGNVLIVGVRVTVFSHFSQFSGVCICGSEGHGVAGESAGEIRQLVQSFAVWICAAAAGR